MIRENSTHTFKPAVGGETHNVWPGTGVIKLFFCSVYTSVKDIFLCSVYTGELRINHKIKLKILFCLSSKAVANCHEQLFSPTDFPGIYIVAGAMPGIKKGV